MIRLLCLFFALLAWSFKSTRQLGAENAAIRHQLIVVRRQLRTRVRFTNNDRWCDEQTAKPCLQLSCLATKALFVLTIFPQLLGTGRFIANRGSWQ
jgi:hypothetical protein